MSKKNIGRNPYILLYYFIFVATIRVMNKFKCYLCRIKNGRLFNHNGINLPLTEKRKDTREFKYYLVKKKKNLYEIIQVIC